MRPKSYPICLSSQERSILKKIKKRAFSNFIQKRVAILLAVDEGGTRKSVTYKTVANALDVSEKTIITTVRDFSNKGIGECLTYHRSPKSDIANLKADGAIQARVITKACSSAPEGYTRWTLTLLAGIDCIILEDGSRLSRATIGRILQAHELRPHLTDYWCIPPKEDAEFAYHMEDILDIYMQPYNPMRPIWCMDEKPFQILNDSREPLPLRAGDIKKVDSEYIRDGTVSIFVFIQPHTGEIIVFVEETRTAVDWAEKIKWLATDKCSDVDSIVLVCDNLNTHSLSSLYKTFSPEEAHAIARKLEVHNTPVHGSWLNIAEQGINIFTRQCLGRRFSSIEVLREEAKAWQKSYNSDPTPINWQFTTDDARVKMKSVYPQNEKYLMDRDEKVAKKREKRKKSKQNKVIQSLIDEFDQTRIDDSID